MTSRLSRAGALALLLALPALAHAQQVYRIVGADGKVTFSDRPVAASPQPAAAAAAPVAVPPAAGVANTGTGTASLPYELRQVAQRYPVTLYTGQDCAPCADARALLRGRGVPFVEKTVSTAADAEALNRLSGASSLPYATIGSQGLRGFSSTEWTQYLDLAAYPKQSQLPANYQAPVPTPLVSAVPAAPAGPAARVSPAVRPAPAQPATPATNPAGIQF